MAAMDVSRKLHAAGLVENVQLKGVEKMAERDPAALIHELGWYAKDPKSAAIKFAESKNLDLCFDLEAAATDGAVSLFTSVDSVYFEL